MWGLWPWVSLRFFLQASPLLPFPPPKTSGRVWRMGERGDSKKGPPPLLCLQYPQDLSALFPLRPLSAFWSESLRVGGPAGVFPGSGSAGTFCISKAIGFEPLKRGLEEINRTKHRELCKSCDFCYKCWRWVFDEDYWFAIEIPTIIADFKFEDYRKKSTPYRESCQITLSGRNSLSYLTASVR